MTDATLVRLLSAIRIIALLPYPFPDGANHDPRLVLARGQIAGLASKAVAEHDDATHAGEGDG